MKGFVKKKSFVLAVSYLSAAALALGILCASLYERSRLYERYVSANYQHAFDEVVTAVSEMDSALEKSLYATTPNMVGAVCTEVFGKAMTAQMSLGALPFSSQELENTSGFISRVGDYAFALSRNASGGQGYSEQELENLRSLSETAGILAVNMKSLQTDMQQGILTMDKLEKARGLMEKSGGESGNSLGESLRLVEKEFPEVPSLIYDGPFSAHRTQGRALSLEGTQEVSEDRARKAASQFSGVSEGKLSFSGECGGDLPCMYFEANVSGGTVSIAVTKQGGKVLGMLSSRQPQESRISAEDAVNTAIRFLESRGYEGMAETYRINQGNIITINFAYKQDGVVCYPDLVKVAVAGDTGAVCGFESRGYIMCHTDRQLPQAAVSADEARARVAAGLSVESERLAVIPTAGGDEKLCYEFVCTAQDGRHYIIYVDSENGQQEKILILLEDETGTLTI